MRDNFTAKTILELRKRVSERCSNPSCTAPTSGPRSDNDKSITIGVAAHICAAAPRGPRFTEHMSSDERSHIRNAIWLCQSCSKLIDNDEEYFSAGMLNGWKEKAEYSALENLGGATKSSNFSIEKTGFTQEILKEVIELSDNNEFFGTENDIKNLAARCAINAIEKKQIAFTVRLLPTKVNKNPDDPLLMPKYEELRRVKSNQLILWLNILTSPSCYLYWQSYLVGVEEWQLVIARLLKMASVEGVYFSGSKIDVWRTDKPELSAPIYLNSTEIDSLLSHLEFESTKCLRFGAYWRAAGDIPDEIILKHVIPMLLFVFVRNKINVEGKLLDLYCWHIGEG